MFSEKEAYSPAELKRIRWSCRRGMLELDKLLQTFFDDYFLTLAPKQQQSFIELLQCPDPELFAWLMGTVQNVPPQWLAIIQQIHLINEKKN